MIASVSSLGASSDVSAAGCSTVGSAAADSSAFSPSADGSIGADSALGVSSGAWDLNGHDGCDGGRCKRAKIAMHEQYDKNEDK